MPAFISGPYFAIESHEYNLYVPKMTIKKVPNQCTTHQVRMFGSSIKITHPFNHQQHSRKAQQRLFKPRASYEEDCRSIADLIIQKFLVFTNSPTNVVLGLGTGPLVTTLIEQLGSQITQGTLPKTITCIPTSSVTASEAAFHGLPITPPDQTGATPPPHLFITDVDDIDLSSPHLPFIIGCAHPGQLQQPQLPQTRKILDQSSTVLAISLSPPRSSPSSSTTTRLRGPLPVFIDEDEWEEIAEELDDIFLGDAEIWRRSNDPDAGPRGGPNPYVSPEGLAIIDIKFYEQGLSFDGDAGVDYGSLARMIDEVPGVESHGLVVGADYVITIPFNNNNNDNDIEEDKRPVVIARTEIVSS